MIYLYAVLAIVGLAVLVAIVSEIVDTIRARRAGDERSGDL